MKRRLLKDVLPDDRLMGGSEHFQGVRTFKG